MLPPFDFELAKNVSKLHKHSCKMAAAVVLVTLPPPYTTRLVEQVMSDVVYKSLAFIGFPNYRVGTDGSVWSCAKNKNVWKRLADRPDSKNHLYASLSHKGKNRQIHVGRLVLLAFVGEPPPGTECCHGPDQNPHNNCLSNLRWDTHKKNMEDRTAQGRTARLVGEDNPAAVLTWDLVRELRSVYTAGGNKNKTATAFLKKHPHLKIKLPSLVTVLRGDSWIE